VAESLKPPADGQSVLGIDQEALRSFALDGLTRRLRVIGVPMETVFA
jgi:hypothetical protein